MSCSIGITATVRSMENNSSSMKTSGSRAHFLLLKDRMNTQAARQLAEDGHRFMEEYRNLGLMHREILGEQVKILESYLAPADFEVDGTRIKKGTWLLAVRIVDDELWRQIKAGDLTGFSIGGSALRTAAA